MAGTGGNMMQSIRTSGSAESGYGVKLGGFHCPSIEFQGRLEELKSEMGIFSDFVQFEQEGYITFIACVQDKDTHITWPRIESFRREPHKFFQDLQKFLSSTRAQYIRRISLTGSLGSLSLTILYRPIQTNGV
jgi:hypothetical protein